MTDFQTSSMSAASELMSLMSRCVTFPGERLNREMRLRCASQVAATGVNRTGCGSGDVVPRWCSVASERRQNAAKPDRGAVCSGAHFDNDARDLDQDADEGRPGDS